MTARVLNRRQARWNMSLSRFDFVINYGPAKQQGLSDALSKRSYLAPRAGEATFDQQCMTLLKPEKFRIYGVVAPIDLDFLNQVRTATIEDSLARDIKQRSNHDKFKVEREICILRSGRIFHKDLHNFGSSISARLFGGGTFWVQ